MKLRFAWIVGLLMTGFPSLFAQTQRCHTTEYQALVENQHPEFTLQRQAIDAHAAAHARNKEAFDSRSTDAVITIPVVVHVLYNTPEENISDDQVFSQIRILNEDFRRLNPDTVNTPVEFQSAAADTRIEFCLADIAPDGQSTSGITRTPTNNASFGFNDAIKFTSMGGKDAWPRDQYMNLWVGDIAGGVLGYAQFPGGAPETDGIVVDYLYFGDIGTATPPFHLGRTATHEVGHWLNLRHIWGDGGCGVDDQVGDTPLAGAPNFDGFPCTFPGPNTCSTGPGDQADMFQNYMDYSEDLCFNLFTKDQSTRMEALFEPGGFREPLLSSNACCPETVCPRVSNFTAVAPDEASISLQWSGIDTAQAYFIEYKQVDSTNWQPAANTTDTTLLISGLELCRQYEVRITTVCANDSSTFCQLLQVETKGCCRAPEVLTANDLNADSANLSWTGIFGANSYEVRYRPEGGNGNWTQFTSTDTFSVLAGLAACQSYEFQVKPNCDTLGNDFSASRQFFTGGCEACTDEDYCTPDANNTLVFVKRVEVAGVFSQTSAADGGYGFFANTSEDLFIDSSYTLILTKGGNFAPPVTWGVWIDFNRDGDFDDANEYVFESASTSDSSIQALLNFSPLTNTGRTRMRVAVKYVSGANDPLIPCELIGTGEYEDYCLNLLPPCKAPVNFAALYDSASAAVFLQWQSELYSDTFAIQYKFLDDNTWTTLPGNPFDFYELADSLLNSCTPYEFRALTVCSDSLSTASKADTIVTPCITSSAEQLAQEVLLMPNPTQGIWFVKAPVQIEFVEVFNLVGQQILLQAGSQQQMEVRMPAVEAGVYLVRIQTAKGSLVKRLLYQP